MSILDTSCKATFQMDLKTYFVSKLIIVVKGGKFIHDGRHAIVAPLTIVVIILRR